MILENASIIKASKQITLYGMSLNQIYSLAAAKRTNPVITIYSPPTELFKEPKV
jgi:Cu(I)/Ag(I) efflux system membrane fusion protein